MLVDLSQEFEQPLEYAFPEKIWEELAAATPAYAGLRYEDIGPRGTRPQALQLV